MSRKTFAERAKAQGLFDGPLETWLIRIEQQAERIKALEVDRDSFELAYEASRKDCQNLTEKVIPNIREQLTAATASLASKDALIEQAREFVDRLITNGVWSRQLGEQLLAAIERHQGGKKNV